MKSAPIILFVYNRLEHTRATLQSLMANTMAAESTLYIYCDGPKADADEAALAQLHAVRQLVKEHQWCGTVEVIEKSHNDGLAASVIGGVTEVINQHGKAIVIEDDLLFSPHFLSFMNEALTRYEQDEQVMQVSGYNFPVPAYKKENATMFLPLTTTWGWGTWKRAWDLMDVDAKGYEQLKINGKMKDRFNLDSSFNYADMLVAQMESDRVSSWGIRWWWSVFLHNGLALFPDHSLVKNNGWDGSGVHCGDEDPFEDKHWQADYQVEYFVTDIEVERDNYQQLKNYLRTQTTPPAQAHQTVMRRGISFLKRKLGN